MIKTFQFNEQKNAIQGQSLMSEQNVPFQTQSILNQKQAVLGISKDSEMK